MRAGSVVEVDGGGRVIVVGTGRGVPNVVVG